MYYITQYSILLVCYYIEPFESISLSFKYSTNIFSHIKHARKHIAGLPYLKLDLRIVHFQYFILIIDPFVTKKNTSIIVTLHGSNGLPTVVT